MVPDNPSERCPDCGEDRGHGVTCANDQFHSDTLRVVSQADLNAVQSELEVALRERDAECGAREASDFAVSEWAEKFRQAEAEVAELKRRLEEKDEEVDGWMAGWSRKGLR